ncbi:hypothetical protein K469DRAFT_660186 [Zopfia rhizophila CBS 207.26]|uniref:BZIP domain-containing protein n=1 Tax=Zopfia rhizophila CBS 207.26 TaxID=1314779 RepID=A0A6A6ECG2_9PEZI|nr:hypothetical protein K469DRAFT_660186 [Zopfia rhizophila CBS 207.26]
MANSSITGPQQTSIAGPQQSSIADKWVKGEDDWSGISDTRERRKIQNRRNQRIRRSRKRREMEFRDLATSESQQLASAHAISISLVSTQQRHTDSEIEAITDAIRSVNILDPESENNRMILQRFEAFVYRYYEARTPQITLLPSLSQFNFIRALLANVEVLGLSSNQMDDDAISPFNSLGSHQAEVPTTLVSRLPAGLRPTDLQCATLHHPWIDLLPVPEMRDNLFRRGLDSFDEDELCHALRGRTPGLDPGVLVWRDPWDPCGWEVTEAFVRSWGWVISGCWDLLRSTNKWRAQRGEKPLFRLPS